METKHTPGPWNFIHEDNDANHVVVSGICEVWSTGRGTGAKVANARLIAAAPEMLAALEALVDSQQSAIEWQITNAQRRGAGGRVTIAIQAGVDALDAARKAIAKAKGAK